MRSILSCLGYRIPQVSFHSQPPSVFLKDYIRSLEALKDLHLPTLTVALTTKPLSPISSLTHQFLTLVNKEQESEQQQQIPYKQILDAIAVEKGQIDVLKKYIATDFRLHQRAMNLPILQMESEKQMDGAWVAKNSRRNTNILLSLYDDDSQE